MLAANVCSADFIARAKHPSLYRVHEGPTPEKKTLLQNYLRALGLGLCDQRRPEARRVPGDRGGDQGPARRGADPPRCCCARCSRRSTPARTAATSASPTRPTPTSRARSGAIPTCSCTASSRRCSRAGAIRSARLPRRRRRRRTAWRGPRRRPRTPSSAPSPRRRWCRAASSRPGKSPARTAAPTSAAPTRRRATSRPGSSAATCASTSARSSAARSRAVTSFGLFVMLDGLYVEGLVHVTELGGEYFRFDEVRQELRGERIGAALRRRHPRAGAGEPGRSRRPQDRLPHGARRRGCGRAAARRVATRRSSAPRRRRARPSPSRRPTASSRRRPRRRSAARSGSALRPVRASKSAVRKTASATRPLARHDAALSAFTFHRRERDQR